MRAPLERAGITPLFRRRVGTQLPRPLLSLSRPERSPPGSACSHATSRCELGLPRVAPLALLRPPFSGLPSRNSLHGAPFTVLPSRCSLLGTPFSELPSRCSFCGARLEDSQECFMFGRRTTPMGTLLRSPLSRRAPRFPLPRITPRPPLSRMRFQAAQPAHDQLRPAVRPPDHLHHRATSASVHRSGAPPRGLWRHHLPVVLRLTYGNPTSSHSAIKVGR